MRSLLKLTLVMAFMAPILMLPVAAKAESCGNLCSREWWKSASIETLRQELTNGANVNVQGKNGATPLHYAAGHGTPETILALIKAGAKIEARSLFGSTPLHWAAESGIPENIRTLI
ncbi:ankyrin repeat domain-containing protein [Alphaproteobacteria bacterium LSUCC0684]